MRAMMLKLVLCEKVTDDLMLALTSPCHRNQVIWQRPISSSAPPSSFFLPVMCFSLFLVPHLLLKLSKCLSLFGPQTGPCDVNGLGSKSAILHTACSLMLRSEGERYTVTITFSLDDSALKMHFSQFIVCK